MKLVLAHKSLPNNKGCVFKVPEDPLMLLIQQVTWVAWLFLLTSKECIHYLNARLSLRFSFCVNLTQCSMCPQCFCFNIRAFTIHCMNTIHKAFCYTSDKTLIQSPSKLLTQLGWTNLQQCQCSSSKHNSISAVLQWHWSMTVQGRHCI